MNKYWITYELNNKEKMQGVNEFWGSYYAATSERAATELVEFWKERGETIKIKKIEEGFSMVSTGTHMDWLNSQRATASEQSK